MSEQHPDLLLPDRHLLLLGKLWEYCIEDSRFQVRELQDVFTHLDGQYPDIWEFRRNPEGKLESAELEGDLDYLHRRGFIFKTANPSVVPTARAQFALEAAKML